MSSPAKIAIGGVIVAMVLWFFLPTWVVGLLVLAAIGVPVAGYLMLDPSQRRRVRAQGRKRLGS
ncbi:hypothetical protein DZF91_10105 [Actinomadura logoneensis]|uniref:Integral membrane protein n=1 Tax=Actinomadura logoneensis TaxID=2293572 RepID=A0A372JP18_9ACTN|nr:hypothetical protein [Actinomadura logoneensis]RFU41767.1 hypothetical protein DZF91_10105 [Actinomadura logoneensis]